MEEMVSLSKRGRYEMWGEGIGERSDVLEYELDGVGREGVHDSWEERASITYL